MTHLEIRYVDLIAFGHERVGLVFQNSIFPIDRFEDIMNSQLQRQLQICIVGHEPVGLPMSYIPRTKLISYIVINNYYFW